MTLLKNENFTEGNLASLKCFCDVFPQQVSTGGVMKFYILIEGDLNTHLTPHRRKYNFCDIRLQLKNLTIDMDIYEELL